MYTAFLALPPLEPKTGKEIEADTTTILETALASSQTSAGWWSRISYALDDALQKLDGALPKNDAVKYVVVPSMFGGLGSVALQMVQDEGTFLDKPNIETNIEAEISANALAGTESNTGSDNLNNTDSETQIAKANHDFVPSIEIHPGLEFLVLVISSVLLGTVVGFIGAVLSLDGPPEEANNKSKLAATALTFALFFPSVITVLQRNAESQTNQLRSQFQSEVKEITQEAEATVQQVEDRAAKNRIDETNRTLNKVNEFVDQAVANDPSQSTQLGETTNTIIEEKSILINDAESLARTATSEESARGFIDSISEIGTTDNEAIRNYAISALEEIQESPEISEAVQQAAREKLSELQTTDLDDAQ